MTREEWLARRTFRGASFDPAALATRKRADELTVSVCLPARNVEATVGGIVHAVRAEWMGPAGLVDEVLVVDGQSADATAARAREAGAAVVREDELLPDLGAGRGKGDAMWRSLSRAAGDLIVWLDADVEDFDPAFVPGLLGPLLTCAEIGYVKAFYRRPLGGRPDDGGRVTEICARPLLNLFYPELAAVVQPLAGEAAGRRGLLERVPFFTGYAVEIGLLIDILRAGGLGSMAQVDLGERRHAHQSTPELGRMAHAITRAVMRRLIEEGRAPEELGGGGTYVRPVAQDGALALRAEGDELVERPPWASLAAAGGRAAAGAR